MADWARAVAKKNNLLPLANDFSAIRANFTVWWWRLGSSRTHYLALKKMVVVVGNCLATPIFIQQMNNLNLKLKPNKQTLEIKSG